MIRTILENSTDHPLLIALIFVAVLGILLLGKVPSRFRLTFLISKQGKLIIVTLGLLIIFVGVALEIDHAKSSSSRTKISPISPSEPGSNQTIETGPHSGDIFQTQIGNINHAYYGNTEIRDSTNRSGKPAK